LARCFASAAGKEASRRRRAANSLPLKNNELLVFADAAQHLPHDENYSPTDVVGGADGST
jgi:hypothetical protein